MCDMNESIYTSFVWRDSQRIVLVYVWHEWVKW